ncbi:hypothetical protein NLJ89_g5155 [Agrocybe chaxingu]|uniref:Ketoreductase domain-containing protein n=1 Tax=Agrocybe chaxingu TaxID=84603 RepID=A0A9W8MXG3_9AGAR|nr:hypothetical protein NLJ89_g5155 [Agrocybe chaxingu]
MPSVRIPPPRDGSVTLPETVDYHREHHPDRPFFVFNADGSPDITEISYLEFARATDRVSHYLRPGRQGPEKQVVALIALSDSLLYQAVSLGIMRGGMISYPMSPRNTAAATVNMIKETNCHRLITTRETLRPLIDEIATLLAADSYEISIEEAPPLLEIFPKLGHEKEEDPWEPYPSAPRPPLDDVLVYLHSSGSTGFPKSIPHTYRAIVHWATFPPLTDIRDHKVQIRSAGMALPCFHTMGMVSHLLTGLYAMVPSGLYPPIATTPKSLPVMPTPQNILDHLVRTKCNAIIIPPAILQVWGNDSKAVELLATLEYVAFAGGAVPPKLGNYMAEQGVYLTQIYGATEFGTPTHFFRKEGDEMDWEYVSFFEDINLRWVPQVDGTFESQFLTCEKHCISIENLPDVRGYSTSDLWIPHPTKPYFWKIVGRLDDVIVHTSSEKTVPAPMEDVLMSSPYFMGVVMFGRNHDQAGVLIELKPQYEIDVNDEEEVVKARNMIWPIVEAANKVGPAFSRIFKEMILFVSSDKPLPRAGKGTVMRKAALKAYAKVEATVKVDTVTPPASWTKADTEAWLKAQCEDIYSDRKFSISGDLFEQGMDSLSATILRRRIVGAMQSHSTIQKASKLVSQTTVYDHPSIAKLAAFLDSVVVDPDNFVATTSRTEAMEQMIAKYSTGLAPLAEVQAASKPIKEAIVLLTGSTGNLGSQLLESLVCNKEVKRIYTLTRPAAGKSVKERHAERFVDKGFDVSLLSSRKIVFLEAEASHRHLGLKKDVYEELRNSVNVIIHNAWKLDFNLSLSSFESNVQGTRNLIDLARASDHASILKFLFTSSIASAFSWDRNLGTYPEEVVQDPKYAVGNGYGESKYVAERVLAISGLQATSFRIGQISGGKPNGAWAVSDWVPIFIKSSIQLAALPSAIGLASWLPMDAVSQTIIDVAFASGNAPALNIVHPSPVTWNYIITALNEALVQEGIASQKLSIVDFQTWFSRLEAKSQEAGEKEINDIPAIKLLDFFRTMAQVDVDLRQRGNEKVESGGSSTFSTAKIQGISSTIKGLPPISHSDVALWIKYWKTAGLFRD